MPTLFPSELLNTFRAMAEIVYSGESYDSVYDAVCRSAVQLVDGCDHASLMLRRGGDRVDTVAASDEVAARIDELEKQLGEGPCLDANAYDYDCEGGDGDGPGYTGPVRIVGDDPYGLDRDGDGVACEPY